MLEESFKLADPNGSGLVSYEVLQETLMKCDMELNDQVLITLMRRFDLSKDGNIAWMDFCMLGGP